MSTIKTIAGVMRGGKLVPVGTLLGDFDQAEAKRLEGYGAVQIIEDKAVEAEAPAGGDAGGKGGKAK